MSNKVSLQSSSEFWDGITFWLAGVGTVLLFISVVTGIRARGYARRWSEEKSEQAKNERRLHDQSIAKLEKETADANARAEEAKRAAAEANLELWKHKQPRMVLSPEQSAKLVAELRALEKRPVEVFAAIQHDEVVWTQKMIVAALREADWDARDNPNRRAPTMSVTNGVAIEILADAPVELHKIAAALAATLRRQGHLEVSGPWASHHFQTDAPIEILIGNKP